MLVSANHYDRIKNKWRNQQIHKIHNDIHRASKHYVTYDNDIIFASKYPINQRKYRKKCENQRKRQDVSKEVAFDFNDFIFKNKNENYQRIQIRPTIYYNHNEGNIAEIYYNFFKTQYSDPFITKFKKTRNGNNYNLTSLNDRKGDNITKTPKDVKETKDNKVKETKDNKVKEIKEIKEIDPEMVWFQSLFEGNKVDIFDDKYKIWCIGTIIEVKKKKDINKDKEKEKEKNNEKMEFSVLVHFDGYSSKYNEWIRRDDKNINRLNDKIQKLHTITAYHEYEMVKNNKNKNNAPCTVRKYIKCRFCDKGYCIKCMYKYLRNNECEECLKSIKKNEWLTNIHKDDKLDAYLYGYRGAVYQNKWHCGWHIGTVIDVVNINKYKLSLFVHFDGFEKKYDEWIAVDCSSNLIRNKLKKLNKITTIHNYLLNQKSQQNKKMCVEYDKWKKCISCHNKCCLKCLDRGIIINDIGYQCNRCGIKREGRDLLNVIKKSLINGDDMMDMKIIGIIYSYSIGITAKCCNHIKRCLNEINFDTKYEMEVNAQQNEESAKSLEIYQYYLHENQKTNINPNTMIYGRKRRVFCAECTKTELTECIICNKNKEIKSMYSWNARYKCQDCIELMIKEKKDKEKEKKKEKEKRVKVDTSDKVDKYFKDFKDNIFPKIILKRARRKQNVKYVSEILANHGVSIDDLPYLTYSMQCKLAPNCYRSYCSFYHNHKEKELGDIISILTQKMKFEKQILRDKSRYFGGTHNADLMDYNFNLFYSMDKMRKRRNNNVSRKYNIKRVTTKRQKRRAYFSRKNDKKSNVKENKKFKAKYCLQLEY